MQNMKKEVVVAGYWDRVANHNTEMQQYLSSLENLTGEDHLPLRQQMQELQRQVVAERTKWQGWIPRGQG